MKKTAEMKKIIDDPFVAPTADGNVEKSSSGAGENAPSEEVKLDPFLNVDPANDDHSENAGMNFAATSKFSKAPSSSLTFFFAGTLATLLIVIALMYGLQYGIKVEPISALFSVAAVIGAGFIGHLLLQYNKLLVEHRKSENLRMHPARVLEASRALSHEIDAMERRVCNFSNLIVEASDQFQAEASHINKSFVSGTDNFHKAFESWLGEARTLSALYDDTLNQINVAQEQIQTSVARFPRDTSQNVESIIETFDGNIDLVVQKLKHRLETDLKFSQLSEMMTEMARVVETLFMSFEEIFVQKLNEIQPQIVDSMMNVSQDVGTALTKSTDRINDQLNHVSNTIKDYNDEFFKKFPDKIAEFKSESYKVMNNFSDAIHANNSQVLEMIKQEKAGFETKSNQVLGEFKSFITDMSTDIKSATEQTETDLDEFLGKFNFNFKEKLKFFSELIDDKSHVMGDQFLVEVDNLKLNFAELAETFSQVIQATVSSFDTRADRTADDIEKHLGGMISKSISSITMRLDLFEEQVLSRLGKAGNAIGDRYDGTSKLRRSSPDNRFNNDYLSILEQQMYEIQQSIADIKRDRHVA